MTEVASTLPAGSSIRSIAFVSSADGAPPLLSMPAPISRHAVLTQAGQPGDLQVLCIPIDPADTGGASDEARQWTLHDGNEAGYQLVALHGAQVHMRLPRVAIVAPADRLETVLRAVIEAAYLEGELTGVEQGLSKLWPDAESDAPLAFEFRARDLPRRAQLGERFAQVVRLRSRLSKLAPRLLVPPPFPPTLAGQVLERFRERLGMGHRLEAIESQFELFERVYDACSERASDFALTRKGLTLEWLIIVLLALQTFLLVFELFVRE